MRERAMRREFTMTKSDGVRVHHETWSNEVRDHHEKKSDRVRFHHKKVGWGESSP